MLSLGTMGAGAALLFILAFRDMWRRRGGNAAGRYRSADPSSESDDDDSEGEGLAMRQLAGPGGEVEDPDKMSYSF